MAALDRKKDISMPSYTDAHKHLAPAEQLTVEGLFESWKAETGAAKRIVSNIKELEHFLPPSNMLFILRALLSFALHTQPLEAFYRSACYHNVRQGGKIDCPTPTSVCRAIEIDIFLAWIYNKYSSVFHIEDNARDFLNDIIIGKTLTSTQKSFYMSEYSAWITWTPVGSTDTPIESFTNAAYIRTCLGIDPEGRFTSDSILLLVYSPPEDLFRPTIADAGLFSQFEPPPHDFAKHGLIRPLQEELSRRPEAIHEPITFDRLRVARRIAP